MKRLLFCIFTAALLAAIPIKAQDGEDIAMTVRLGIGTPGAGPDYFTDGTGSYTSGLSGIYGDYFGPATTSGTITADVSFSLSRHFALGIDLGFGHYSNTLYNGISDETVKKRHGYALYALPTVKIFYLEKPMVSLYSAAGLGIAKYAGFDNLINTYTTTDYKGRTWSRTDNRTLKFEAQFTPFGIEVGKRFFGFGEVCLGTMLFGVRGGIGYRF